MMTKIPNLIPQKRKIYSITNHTYPRHANYHHKCYKKNPRPPHLPLNSQSPLVFFCCPVELLINQKSMCVDRCMSLANNMLNNQINTDHSLPLNIAIKTQTKVIRLCSIQIIIFLYIPFAYALWFKSVDCIFACEELTHLPPHFGALHTQVERIML